MLTVYKFAVLTWKIYKYDSYYNFYSQHSIYGFVIFFPLKESLINILL